MAGENTRVMVKACVTGGNVTVVSKALCGWRKLYSNGQGSLWLDMVIPRDGAAFWSWKMEYCLKYKA